MHDFGQITPRVVYQAPSHDFREFRCPPTRPPARPERGSHKVTWLIWRCGMTGERGAWWLQAEWERYRRRWLMTGLPLPPRFVRGEAIDSVPADGDATRCETYRRTDRQTDRRTDVQTDRQASKKTWHKWPFSPDHQHSYQASSMTLCRDSTEIGVNNVESYALKLKASGKQMHLVLQAATTSDVGHPAWPWPAKRVPSFTPLRKVFTRPLDHHDLHHEGAGLLCLLRAHASCGSRDVRATAPMSAAAPGRTGRHFRVTLYVVVDSNSKESSLASDFRRRQHWQHQTERIRLLQTLSQTIKLPNIRRERAGQVRCVRGSNAQCEFRRPRRRPRRRRRRRRRRRDVDEW